MTERERTQESILFTTEEEEEVEFFVLEQTRIGGVNYILVADSEEEEAEALILKELPQGEKSDGEAVYDIVEEEQELTAISKVFMEMLEDVEIQVERES